MKEKKAKTSKKKSEKGREVQEGLKSSKSPENPKGTKNPRNPKISESQKTQKTSFLKSLKKTARSVGKLLPLLLAVLLLVSLVQAITPKWIYEAVFTKIAVLDSFIGGIAGSILAGNPVTSYIIGGELLKQGVGLAAVTAFIVAWVTVGIVQLPAEIGALGKRFAIARNIAAFLLSILIGFVTYLVMAVL